MSKDATPLTITSRDAESMLDTACTNPDKDDFTCPPDGVRGLSTITRQKISKGLTFNGTAYDVYIVQWDHEPVNGANCVGNYVATGALPPSSSFWPGQYILSGNFASWSGTYALTLETGGLMVYFMNPNESPFPTNGASGVVGPKNPVKTFRLNFGNDILHDNTRILGSNYELIDDTADLTAQGSMFQGAWDANVETSALISMLNGQGGSPPTSNFFQSSSCRFGELPPGDTEQLIKLNNNRISKAKMGTFVMNRLGWSDNQPENGFGVNELYESIDDHPANVGRVALLLTTANALSIQIPAGTVLTSQQPFQAGDKIYQTRVGMNMTVLTGLPKEWTASLTREIISQSFIKPGSKYSAFAKMSYMPVDYNVMAALQNTMDNLPMFQPSKSNANGFFAKTAKTLFKKAAPAIRAIAPIAARALGNIAPPGVAHAMEASASAVNAIIKNASKGAPLGEGLSKDQLLNYVYEKAVKQRLPKSAQKAIDSVAHDVKEQRKETKGKRNQKGSGSSSTARAD